MGTFHEDLGELHGITVVVETDGPLLFIGRCHEETAGGVILLDADLHDADKDSMPREEYLARAIRFGVWKKHDRVAIPRERVISIRRLGEMAAP
ncbi:MAG: hypothetical protein ACE5GW_11665 [Planctomycetota bacterium]